MVQLAPGGEQVQMTDRVFPVYFLGVDESLSDKLLDCYGRIVWGPEYPMQVDFRAISKSGWASTLSQRGDTLVFLEIDSDGTDKEFTLIQDIRARNPRAQFVLLADPRVDYFRLAQRCLIGNILKKDGFDASAVRALSIRLLTGNIFGFGPYFPLGYTIGPIYRTYRGWVELDTLIKTCFEFFLGHIHPEETALFKSFLHELLSNTVAYALGKISAEERDRECSQPPKRLFVPERNSIKVSMVADAEKTAFSVQDSTGSLTMQRVLEKLRRQSCIGDETLPPGMFDETGRGMALLHKQSRVVVNILQGVRTETIFMYYNQMELNRHESVMITQLAPPEI